MPLVPLELVGFFFFFEKNVTNAPSDLYLVLQRVLDLPQIDLMNFMVE